MEVLYKREREIVESSHTYLISIILVHLNQREMLVENLYFAFASILISCVFSVYFTRNALKQVSGLLKNSLTQLREGLDEELEPMKHVNKRAMGLLQSEGLRSKEELEAERLIGEDLLLQLPIPIEIIESIFPSFAEKIRENPALIPKMLPRIMKLLENTDFEALTKGYKSGSKTHLDWK